VENLSKLYSFKTEFKKKLKVLHLCSDFANKNIYKQLVTHLEEINISQVVYSAVRTEAEAKWKSKKQSDTEYCLRYILRPYHRLFFRAKIRKVSQDLYEYIDLSNIGLVHAHFLYSDGAVALQLKKKLSIPYIVAVRNTDINIFRRYRPDLTCISNEVLRNASRVVFISPAYRNQFLSSLRPNMRIPIEQKAVVVPNGLESNWLTFAPPAYKSYGDLLRIIYVGDFNKNKNIPGILQAISILAVKQNVNLTLVGGGGNGEREVKKLLSSGKYNFVRYLGKIENGPKLRAIYREHDLFIMPSFRETFGVVYIEALSQGLPIIYSHGQAVDGYFPQGTISEDVDPRSPVDIANKIQILANRRKHITQKCVVEAKKFAWSQIAKTYKKIYASVLLNDM